MDLQEWEIVPDDGFLEINDDGGKKIFSRKFGSDPEKSVFQMNYFICPNPDAPKFLEPTEKSIVPLIQLDSREDENPLIEREIGLDLDRVPTQIKSVISEKIKVPSIGDFEADRDDSVSQVFFKKMKENEFVDMKLDSPTYKGDAMESKNCALKEIVSMESELGSEIREETSWGEEEEEDNNGGLKMWKWCFSGIGAICSFGIAASTICIVILGSSQRNNNKHHQKLKFQIYTHDKRIKEVVQNATKLNEAISAARGVSLTRAHITFGGRYEGL